LEVDAGESRWRCGLIDYVCARTGEARAGRGMAGQQGRGFGPRGEAPSFIVSPDGKTEAFIQNFNIAVRAVDRDDRAAHTMLSFDGSEGDAYQLRSIRWSPDSKRLVAYRARPGYNRTVYYVLSSPPDQRQPKLDSIFYRKPGDLLDVERPVLFDVASGKQTVVDDALFPNAYDITQAAWRPDGRAFTFEYNQRGHQVYRIIEVDGASGKARAVISEEVPTFFDYRTISGSRTDSGRKFRFDVADGREIIWMSQRDGWNHLYLYDGATGKVKNQITRGKWVVSKVDSVDVSKRQIWFQALGMNPGQDPYLVHYYRINFDGSGLLAYTEADGDHTLTWSPDREYYLDRYSRVDLPTVLELRRASDRKVLAQLEKGDMTAELATGWRPPEVFVAKGRDGVTDIWGIIVRPTNFDPAKKYAVVENIYAGPQGSFVPKEWSSVPGMQAMAELGFIVVQIDGMGTNNRSKAFHDVAWKNLADGGLPDRILWHQAAAKKYPSYDITRVGVTGGSAGGQNTASALLFHGDFYKVGVARSGCYDNRMDKIWWNELYMGWPLGPHYDSSSAIVNAHRLKGRFLIGYGEHDVNVDPASSLQLINALVDAGKYFDVYVQPNGGHGIGGQFNQRRDDYLVKYLLGVEPPDWNNVSLGLDEKGLTLQMPDTEMDPPAGSYEEPLYLSAYIP
jgi:dipeptidyl aminopeptidase/acylaminoacyl peptidase